MVQRLTKSENADTVTQIKRNQLSFAKIFAHCDKFLKNGLKLFGICDMDLGANAYVKVQTFFAKYKENTVERIQSKAY